MKLSSMMYRVVAVLLAVCTIAVVEGSALAEKGDQYDLSDYTYYPVTTVDRGTLLFLSSPEESFMTEHSFSDEDYVFSNAHNQLEDYSVTSENGEYGHTDRTKKQHTLEISEGKNNDHSEENDTSNSEVVPFGEVCSFTTQIRQDGTARRIADDSPYETLTICIKMVDYWQPRDYARKWGYTDKLRGNEAGAVFQIKLKDYTGSTRIVPQNIIDTVLASESGDFKDPGYVLTNAEIGGSWDFELESNRTQKIWKRINYSNKCKSLKYMMVITYNDGRPYYYKFELTPEMGDGNVSDDPIPGLPLSVMKSDGTVMETCQTSIAAGNCHTVGLLADGTVVATGDNEYGQCDTENWESIVAVTAGGFHTVGLRSDGKVVAIGANSDGRCQVGNWQDIVSIAAGMNHTVGLQANGMVVATGDNSSGRCDVFDWENIAAIAAGYSHTLGLCMNGTVFATGENYAGQCNVDGWRDIVAIAAGDRHTVGLRADGTTVAVGMNSDGQCEVDDWKNIVAIAAGKDHTVGLRADGTVVAAGYNGDGRCDVSEWTDIVAIAAHGIHTVGLRADGTAIAVGGSGELYSRQGDVSGWKDIVSVAAGHGCTIGLQKDGRMIIAGDIGYDVNNWTDIAAIDNGEYHTVGLRSDGTVTIAGYDDVVDLSEASDWTDIVAIATGEAHVVGLRSDGTVVAAGGTGEDDLGQNRVDDWKDIMAIAAGGYFTLGLRNDGTVVAAGENYEGQCQVDGWTNVVEIDAGLIHTLGLRKDGTVVAAGYNGDGQCDVSGWTNIKDIAAGPFHSVGLRDDGTVVATGINDRTQCNVSEWTDITSIAAGPSHTVGLKADGTVVTTGERDDRCEVAGWTNLAVTIPEITTIRENPEALDDIDIVHSPLSVTLSDDSVVETRQGAIAAGGRFTIGLRSDGTAVAAGYNDDGQCDVGGWSNLTEVAAGTWDSIGLKADGMVVTSGSSHYNTSGWKDIVAVAAGDHHIVGLRDDGTVIAMGRRDYGQCNVETWTNIVSVAAGGSHTVGLRADGTVAAMGYNDNGQCNVEQWTDIVAVDAGRWHTVGLRMDGTVAVTGNNKYGQCDVNNWKNIVAIAAGDGHTVGLRADGTVVAVGYNESNACEVSDWKDIVAIAGGTSHTVGLRADGTVAAVGYHDGNRCDVSSWKDVSTIVAGWNHTVGLCADGTVIAAGQNDNGQCDVDMWRDIIAIDAGLDHSVGLKSNGTVVATGSNNEGQCDVDEWTDVVSVVTGYRHTVGLRSDGTVVAAGCRKNNHHQCDVGYWTDISAIAAGEYHTVGLKRNGTVIAVGENGNGQCDVADWRDIVAIATGENHTVGLKSDGTVIAVGCKTFDFHQCDVEKWTDIVAIDAGVWHTTGLKSDGTVVAVGETLNGLCDVEGWTNIVAITDGVHRVLGLRADGRVVAKGTNLYGECDVASITDIVAVAEGIYHTVCLRSDGTVVSTGYNDYNRCDVGGWTDINSSGAVNGDIVIPRGTELAIEDEQLSVGSTVMFGHYDQDGDAANGAETIEWIVLKNDGMTATLISKFGLDVKPYNVENVDTTWENSHLRLWLNDEFLKAAFSEEEQSMIENIDVKAGANPLTQVYAGSDTQDKVYLLSIEEVNSLFMSDESRICIPTRTAVAHGGNVGSPACCWWLRSPGIAPNYAANVSAFGFVLNDGFCSTHCGNAVRPAITLRLLTAPVEDRNTHPKENTEAALPRVRPMYVRLSDGSTVEARQGTIAASKAHSIIANPDGTAVASGNNEDGQCDVEGWTDIVAVAAGWRHSAGLRSDGTVVTAGWRKDGQCETEHWTNIVSLTAGGFHTIGLNKNGTVVATGRNYDKQCEVGGWKDIVALAAGINHTVGLRSDGTVIATGDNSNGQCDVDKWTDVVAIAAGNDNTVGLCADGTVVAIGDNTFGQCNVGDWTDIIAADVGYGFVVGLKSDGTVISSGLTTDGRCDVGEWADIVAIATGDEHTLGLRSDGTLIAVGSNQDNQCGVCSKMERWPSAVETEVKTAESVIVPFRNGYDFTAQIWKDGTARIVADDAPYETLNFRIKVKDFFSIDTVEKERNVEFPVQGDRASVTFELSLKKHDRHIEIVPEKIIRFSFISANGSTEELGDPLTNARTDEPITIIFNDRTITVQKSWECIDEDEPMKYLAATVYNDGKPTTILFDLFDNTSASDPELFKQDEDNRLDQNTARDMTLKTGAGEETVSANDQFLSDNGLHTSDSEMPRPISKENRTVDTLVGTGCARSPDAVAAAQQIVSISARNDQTVLLSGKGRVTVLGSNLFNEHEVGNWRHIVGIATGAYQTIGLRSDGKVFTTEDSEREELSHWMDIVAVAAGSYHIVGLKSDGTVVAAGNNLFGECDVESWEDIRSISAGNALTLGLRSDGTVVAAGSNACGQCDVGSWTDIVAIAAGDDFEDKCFAVGVKSDGTVVAVGDNDYGQCNVSNWKDIIAVAAGLDFTMGLKRDGTVIATGKNDYGECDVNNWYDITAIAAGAFHSVALKSDGTMMSSGSNSEGQRGNAGINVENLPIIPMNGEPQIVPFGEICEFTTEISRDGNPNYSSTDAPYDTLTFRLEMKERMLPKELEKKWNHKYIFNGDWAAVSFELTLVEYTGKLKILPTDALKFNIVSASCADIEYCVLSKDNEMEGEWLKEVESDVPVMVWARYDFTNKIKEYLTVTTWNKGVKDTILFELAPKDISSFIPDTGLDYPLSLDIPNVLSFDTCGEIKFSNELLEEDCGAECAVAVLDTTGGIEISHYAEAAFTKWGIGDVEKNNGFLLILAIDDGNFFALPGEGLRSILPSEILLDLLDQYLEPAFSDLRYDDGVRMFYEVVFDTIAKSYHSEASAKRGIDIYNSKLKDGSWAVG